MNTDTLNDLKCGINKGLANYSYQVVKQKSLYLPCDKDIFLKEIFLYAWAIDDWEQNPNGTTTGYYNYITEEDLQNIYERISPMCGC